MISSSMFRRSNADGVAPRAAGALAVVIALVSLTSVRLTAHDMWIEPLTFFPELGQIVSVRFRVGQDLLGDPLPLDPALVNQFIVEDSAGRKPVVQRDGRDPAGLLRVALPGLLVIGYRSNPSVIDLAAEKFNQYLKEEGLDAVAVMRAQNNQTGAHAREAFARCAKSLIVSGATAAPQRDRPLGFTLELVAERNPYLMHVNDEMPLQLLYRGQPIANVLVVAMNRQDPAARIKARTDATGHVTFKLGQRGMWLIKAVHMVPAPAGLDASWASYWASTTFDLKDTVSAVSTP
jgi:uncharacterized GH25 family protein